MAASDQTAGVLARLATTLGQAALVILGVHLVADQIDELVLQGLEGLGDALSALELPPILQVVRDLPVYLPLRPVSAWAALAVEILASTLLIGSFLLSHRRPTLRAAELWRARCIHALVLPATLSGVLLAGGWSLVMAVEDLTAQRPLGLLIGAAALVRFGWPAWHRALGALDPDPPRRRGLFWALILVPVGILAWTRGVPLWGWL